MSSRTWACFACRLTVRRPATYGRETLTESVACPECGRECFNLGYKIRVPKRRDDRAWEELRAQIFDAEEEQAEEAAADSVRLQHTLEQRIAELESRPSDPQRERLIRDLRRQLGGT
jgi:hypothetical protein